LSLITKKYSFKDASQIIRPRFDALRKEHRRIAVVKAGGLAAGSQRIFDNLQTKLLLGGYNIIGFRYGFTPLLEKIKNGEILIDGEDYIEFGSRPFVHGNDDPLVIGTGRPKLINADFVSKGAITPEEDNLFIRFIECLLDLNIGGIVMLGGDGTLSLAWAFKNVGIPVVGIGKSMDDDYPFDPDRPQKFHTFGFESTVCVIRDGLMRMVGEVGGEQSCIFVEVMGRNSGFVAHRSAAAADWQLLLRACEEKKEPRPINIFAVSVEDVLPNENLEHFCERIASAIISHEKHEKRHMGRPVIVLSESVGIKFYQEIVERTGKNEKRDPEGRVEGYSLDSCGVISRMVEKFYNNYYKKIGSKGSILKFRSDSFRFNTRVMPLDWMSKRDIRMCENFGIKAAKLVVADNFDVTVVPYGRHFIEMERLIDPVTNAVKKRTISPDSNLWKITQRLRSEGQFLMEENRLKFGRYIIDNHVEQQTVGFI